MNVIYQFLADRDELVAQQREADQRFLVESAGIDPAQRLMAWDRWLRGQLKSRLKWPADAAGAQRLISQCAVAITRMAKQLRGRGWMLDGNALAEHVRNLLEQVAVAQSEGEIRDFWPFFSAVVERYVGTNAEEIQAHARRSGGDAGVVAIGDAMAALVGRAPAGTRRTSLTELLAVRTDETLREQLARRRRQQDQAAAEATQMPLL